jgi:hypothetical protein
LAKFHPDRKWLYLFRGLALAVFFHGVFDFFLFLQDSPEVTRYVSAGLLFLGALASFVIALNLSNRAIRSHTELSREMHGEDRS